MRAVICLLISAVTFAAVAPDGIAASAAFQENSFREAVSRALNSVKQLLDTTRNPVLAAPEVAHAYSDKYVLAEFTTNTAIAAQLNALEALGLSDDSLQRLLQLVEQHRTVTLRLTAEERCKHLRTTTREVESPTARVTSYGLGLSTRETVVTKVTEYFWQFEVSYELLAFRGAGTSQDTAVTLQKRWATTELKTLSEQRPRPEVLVRPPLDVDVTWLLRHTRLSGAQHTRRATFAIERADEKQCRTPRRNPQSDAAIASFHALSRWAGAVREYFLQSLLPTAQDHGRDLGAASDDSTVFVPVAPLFEATAASLKALHDTTRGPTAATGVVPLESVNQFLAEQALTLRHKRDALAKAFPTRGDALVSFAEAWLVLVLKHMSQISRMAIDSVDYIEAMLYAQLRSAIGKDLQAVDFQHFARYHMRKLYRDEYQPRPFTYAVRRPAYDPEGVVSLEAVYDDGGVGEPVHTIVSSAYVGGGTGSGAAGGSGSSSSSSSSAGSGSGSDSGSTSTTTTGANSTQPQHHTSSTAHTAGTMYFALDASRRVAFGGERHVHGWINQQFSGSSGLRLNLVARARQFSSFILMVGRITSADTFEAKHAMIIKNKDDLKIPLMLETIPTPKEFRDAIESLSPEQQRFAKGYRAMQLESTLFAVCIIQIKPALEKVLNLPDDALTKEIELTQDLLELFIEYQIPTDLLSFSPNVLTAPAGVSGVVSTAERVNVVRGFVSKMKDMIKRSKTEALTNTAMHAANTVLSGARPPIVYEQSMPYSSRASHDAIVGLRVEKNVLGRMGALMSDFLGGAVPASAPAPVPLMQMASMAAPPPPPTPPSASASPITVPAVPGSAATQQPKPQPQTRNGDGETTEPTPVGVSVVRGTDYTSIPTRLERAYEELDTDGALRPTIVNPSDSWTKRSQKTLLAEAVTEGVGVDVQGRERSRAFDLIDALTKSGDPRLTLDHAALHVFIAATHCFDKTLVDTVIQQNVNPIERVERSSLIVASTIHGVAPHALVQPHQLPRLSQLSPHLIPSESLSAADSDGVLTDAKSRPTTGSTNPSSHHPLKEQTAETADSADSDDDRDFLPL